MFCGLLCLPGKLRGRENDYSDTKMHRSCTRMTNKCYQKLDLYLVDILIQDFIKSFKLVDARQSSKEIVFKHPFLFEHCPASTHLTIASIILIIKCSASSMVCVFNLDFEIRPQKKSPLSSFQKMDTNTFGIRFGLNVCLNNPLFMFFDENASF